MEDRFSHRLTSLSIPVLGLAVIGFLVVRAGAGGAFWRVGLWAYLATVDRTWPDRKLVEDAQQASANLDILVPYWGSQGGRHTESANRELTSAESA